MRGQLLSTSPASTLLVLQRWRNDTKAKEENVPSWIPDLSSIWAAASQIVAQGAMEECAMHGHPIDGTGVPTTARCLTWFTRCSDFGLSRITSAHVLIDSAAHAIFSQNGFMRAPRSLGTAAQERLSVGALAATAAASTVSETVVAAGAKMGLLLEIAVAARERLQAFILGSSLENSAPESRSCVQPSGDFKCATFLAILQSILINAAGSEVDKLLAAAGIVQSSRKSNPDTKDGSNKVLAAEAAVFFSALHPSVLHAAGTNGSTLQLVGEKLARAATVHYSNLLAVAIPLPCLSAEPTASSLEKAPQSAGDSSNSSSSSSSGGGVGSGGGGVGSSGSLKKRKKLGRKDASILLQSSSSSDDSDSDSGKHASIAAVSAKLTPSANSKTLDPTVHKEAPAFAPPLPGLRAAHTRLGVAPGRRCSHWWCALMPAGSVGSGCVREAVRVLLTQGRGADKGRLRLEEVRKWPEWAILTRADPDLASEFE